MGTSRNENAELDHKWRLVQEIVSQPVEGRDLSGEDLSDADLSGANVEKARFGNNQGISEPIKLDPIQRGAIFIGEPPTQDSRVLVNR